MNSLTVSSKRVQRPEGKKYCLGKHLQLLLGKLPPYTTVLKIAVNNAKPEM